MVSAGKAGLLWIACFGALDEHQMSYHLMFDEVFPKPDRRAGAERFCAAYPERGNVTTLSPSAAAADRYRKSGENS